ncbi:hypothetical protein MPSEU_000399200 [Mayamaea pseudoterrestris]|nr:hypothetical protein MPSEU_000399200 [Mayamaea pseudoterrestris]
MNGVGSDDDEPSLLAINFRLSSPDMVAPNQSNGMISKVCNSSNGSSRGRQKYTQPSSMLRYASCLALLLLVGRQFYPLRILPSTNQLADNRQRETSLVLQHASDTNTAASGGRRISKSGKSRTQPLSKQTKKTATIRRHPSNTQNSATDSSSIAACMLMKDDNHWLIEWLAFHYHVLPLRDLILVRDPHSQTSPEPVLQKWRSRMNITEWDGDKVVPDFKWQQYRSGKIDDTRLHRARQQFFYADCLRHFQEQGKQWILLTDTDEFIQPNFYALPSEGRVPLEESGSVLRTLHLQTRLRRQQDRPVPKCLHIPRIQMASHQTIHASNDILPSLNTSHMLTTSWLHHNGHEIIQVPGANLDGKNILNVASMGHREIPSRAHSVHMVVPKYCPATNGNRLEHEDSWLVVYHYPGTYEQYTYRADPRDALAHRPKRWDLWREMGEPNATSIRDESMGMWLPGFVKSVGEQEAERLLEHVGVLEELPEKKDAESEAAVKES